MPLVICPACRAEQIVPRELVGLAAPCRACGAEFVAAADGTAERAGRRVRAAAADNPLTAAVVARGVRLTAVLAAAVGLAVTGVIVAARSSPTGNREVARARPPGSEVKPVKRSTTPPTTAGAPSDPPSAAEVRPDSPAPPTATEIKPGTSSIPPSATEGRSAGSFGPPPLSSLRLDPPTDSPPASPPQGPAKDPFEFLDAMVRPGPVAILLISTVPLALVAVLVAAHVRNGRPARRRRRPSR